MNIQTIPAVPRFKTILNSARFVRNPISVLSENTENYGATYHTYIGGVFPAILSTDAGFIQHVLQKNHRNYKKSPIHFEKLGHFLGNGLLTSDGEYWLRQRRLIQPGFHRDRLAGLTGIMNGVLDDFIASFDRRIAQRQPIDISENMLEVAFRIIARSLFSTDVSEEELGKTERQYYPHPGIPGPPDPAALQRGMVPPFRPGSPPRKTRRRIGRDYPEIYPGTQGKRQQARRPAPDVAGCAIRGHRRGDE
jgi:cytochrome P450